MNTIQQVANWRISPQIDELAGCPFVETQTDGGEWFFPDCAFSCKYCDMCLGCQRKMMMFNDGDGWYLDEKEIRCEKSPTGYHVADTEESDIEE